MNNVYALVRYSDQSSDPITLMIVAAANSDQACLFASQAAYPGHDPDIWLSDSLVIKLLKATSGTTGVLHIY